MITNFYTIFFKYKIFQQSNDIERFTGQNVVTLNMHDINNFMQSVQAQNAPPQIGFNVGSKTGNEPKNSLSNQEKSGFLDTVESSSKTGNRVNIDLINSIANEGVTDTRTLCKKHKVNINTVRDYLTKYKQ